MKHSISQLNEVATHLAFAHWVDLEDYSAILLELYALGLRGSEYEDEISVLSYFGMAIRDYHRVAA